MLLDKTYADLQTFQASEQIFKNEDRLLPIQKILTLDLRNFLSLSNQ